MPTSLKCSRWKNANTVYHLSNFMPGGINLAISNYICFFVCGCKLKKEPACKKERQDFGNAGEWIL